jgi:glucose-1-phosphate adenylyltransferase
MGVLQVDPDLRVRDFVEKPPREKDVAGMEIPCGVLQDAGEPQAAPYLGSMGMYVFNAAVLQSVLDNDFPDFAREVIPHSIGRRRVHAFVFSDFWVDIGTIRSFYDTNLDLASPVPSFNFYDEEMPIYTHRKHLPATKINNCSLYRSLTAEGCIITESSITNSLIGLRSIVNSGTHLDGVVCMGADLYETPEQLETNKRRGVPNIGIGAGSLIRNCIIDTNVRIGDDCRIGVDSMRREDGEYECHYVRDGIIIIPKNAVVPSGTTI